jgi:putative Holliday junction resolvase
MQVMAIDLGDRRTGIAIGDEETGAVMPLEVLEVERGPRLIEALQETIAAHSPGRLVIGLPLNMDGTEGDRATICRTFGAQLSEATGLAYACQDERLSSHEADARMARSGRTHGKKKQLRDALAACVVLEDHFAAKDHDFG